MPPDSLVREDELNELLVTFKQVNETLYTELISVTGYGVQALRNLFLDLLEQKT